MPTRLAFLFLFAAAQRLDAVTPLPVGALLQHKANYFDLQHKRLRFTRAVPPHTIVASLPTAEPSIAASHSTNRQILAAIAGARIFRFLLPLPGRTGMK